MKQSICFLVFFLLLVSLSPASSRFLSASEVKEEVKHEKVVTQLAYSMETTHSLNKLMGLEGCEDEDEECSKTRIIAEAHLDYIYTQNHDHP